MTKISEALSYFTHLEPLSEIDAYYEDKCVYTKVRDLMIMQEAIGDVELTEDYLKVFLYVLSRSKFKETFEQTCEKVRLVYELSKDTELSRDELITLFVSYHHGIYTYSFEEIKDLVDSHKSLVTSLRTIKTKALEYGKKEAEKLECLKDKYSSEFVERIQAVVQDELLSSDSVLKILPSKEFIESSVQTIPLGYDIFAAEDLVIKRLKSKRYEEDYQAVSDDEKIILGDCSSGEKVYTPFTKGEYEKDLESKKQLIRK